MSHSKGQSSLPSLGYSLWILSQAAKMGPAWVSSPPVVNVSNGSLQEGTAWHSEPQGVPP